MKNIFSTTKGRILLGCIFAIVVIGIVWVGITMNNDKKTEKSSKIEVQEETMKSVSSNETEASYEGNSLNEEIQEKSSHVNIENNTNNNSQEDNAYENLDFKDKENVTKSDNNETTEVITEESTNKTTEVITEESTNKTTSSESDTKVDPYYENNSTVIDVINASESKDVPTEKEAVEMLKKRGFDKYPVIYDYLLGGKYVGETEIINDSNDKHPMYQTYFVSENGDFWTIYLINGVVMVNPVSFNLQSDLGSQMLISESDNLTSYSSDTDQFYVSYPNKSEAIVKKIDKITADSLNRLTYEEIRNYEN